MKPKLLLIIFASCLAFKSLYAQQTSAIEDDSSPDIDPTTQSNNELAESPITDETTEDSARSQEAALNEDPEAQRRTQIEEQPDLRDDWPKIVFYGSVRLHVINHFDADLNVTDVSMGDGGSRVGVRGGWQMTRNWHMFGRVEAGFDMLEDFTDKGNVKEGSDGGIEERLTYLGLDSDRFTATYGKNWSSYYKIAGMADRFSIFGGSSTGVYNAHTDGGGTGTGRADDVLQLKLYTSSLKAVKIKPFNINVQYQYGQPIPAVDNRNYGKAWGASAWLETQTDKGIGLAYHRADIENPLDPVIEAAGIDGDATAFAMSFRTFGEHWYAALVIARLDNINTTDELKYFNGYGAELYSQWEFKDRWWLIAGGNWSKPDSDDENAGEYKIAYGILGLRYTLDSFNRMLYAEYRIDHGSLTNGENAKNEITLGIRWDFGY